MKTEQEQTKQMLKTLCDKFQCSAIDRSYMAKSCRQCEDIIEALHEAGYGNISEYKAEIERLEQQNAIQCDAWQKLSDENERLVTENNSNLRYNSVLRKENKKLKEEIKQAQLGVLGKLKMIEFDDEKVKRIFNEVGLTVEKREQPLTDEELDKQVKEIMSCYREAQNGEDKS